MVSIWKVVFIAFEICMINGNEEHKQERSKVQSSNADLKSACNNILPESQWFQYGFDKTKLDLYKCPQIGGKRQQIFVIDNCFYGQQWTNKYTNKTLDVPNNLLVGENHRATQHKYNTKAFTDIHAYVEYLKDDVYIDNKEEVAFPNDYYEINNEKEDGLFSSSDDYQNIKEKLENNTIIEILRKIVLYDIHHIPRLSPEEELHENFVAMSKNLPKDFKHNPLKFIEFIQTFGTHYVILADFGATVRHLRTFERSKWENYSTDELILRAQNDFPSLSSSDKEMCKDSNLKIYKYAGSDYEKQYFGISPNELNEVGFERVSSVIAKNPYVVSVELIPIWYILNGHVAKEMEKAINAYMAKAHLDDSVWKLKIKLSNGLPKTKYTDGYLEQYETINQTNNYDLQLIQNLTSTIRFEAEQTVPRGLVINGTDSTSIPDSVGIILPNYYSLFIFALIKFVAIRYFSGSIWCSQ